MDKINGYNRSKTTVHFPDISSLVEIELSEVLKKNKKLGVFAVEGQHRNCDNCTSSSQVRFTEGDEIRASGSQDEGGDMEATAHRAHDVTPDRTKKLCELGNSLD